MTCKTRRNARGLGSIRQRPDVRWEGRLTIGKDPGTGKQVQRSVYGDTQREVLQALQKLAVERDTGVYTAPTKITVKQWLEIWLDEYTGGVKSSTQVSYRQHAQNHIIPALGAVKLSALKAPAVQKFYNGLQRREKPLSSKTVKNIHGVLHQALGGLHPSANRKGGDRAPGRGGDQSLPRCPGRQRVFHAPESRPVHGNAGGGNSGPAMGLRGL